MSPDDRGRGAAVAPIRPEDLQGDGDAAHHNGDAEPLVGRRLREMRHAHGLSAKEVARRAGVSRGYLSRLEHDKVSPTVTTLTRVVEAMGESVVRLFRGEATGPLVRRHDRRVMRNRGVDDHIVTPSRATQLAVLETVIQPNSGSGGTDAFSHEGGEECVLVLDGVLRAWVDDLRYDLYEGDAITFFSNTPHRWQNPGTTDARVLWILTRGASLSRDAR